MKKVSVTARKEDLDNVKAILKAIPYSVEKEGNLVWVSFYLSDAELDNIITMLENTIDMRYKESIIEVYTPDFVISSSLQRSFHTIQNSL